MRSRASCDNRESNSVVKISEPMSSCNQALELHYFSDARHKFYCLVVGFLYFAIGCLAYILQALILVSLIHSLIKFLPVFAEKKHVTNVQPILSAKVPVLKVTDCGTGIECDLSVGNMDGIAKSHIILMVSSIDERFKKLCFLVSKLSQFKCSPFIS